MILYKQFLQAMRIHKSSRYPFYRRFKPDHNLRNDGSTSGSALSQSREFGVDKHTTAELLEIQSTRISLQATREALALEAGQRHYFEEEVRRLNVDLDQWHEWASSHSERDTQLEVLISDCQKLQQENFWLRGEYEKLQIQVRPIELYKDLVFSSKDRFRRMANSG